MFELEDLAGVYIGSSELVEKLREKGFEAEETTICRNSAGYFAIVKAAKNGETVYLGVESFTGEPICVGAVTLMTKIELTS
jgi:arginine repressor